MKPTIPFLFAGLSLTFFFHQSVHSQEKYPTATPTDKPGVVISPYAKDRLLDVEGLKPGDLAEDPVAGKVFRIPARGIPKAGITSSNQGDPIDSDPGIQFGDGLPPNRIPGDDPDGLRRKQVPRDLFNFLVAFNQASAVNNPGELIPFYGERVDSYFGTRNVSQQYIVKDRAQYINRYPERKYTIEEEPVLISSDGTHFDVIARVNYMTKGSKGVRNGSVTDYLKIRRRAGGFEIYSIEEAKAKSIPTGINPGSATVSNFDPIIQLIEAFTASGNSNDPAANVNFMHSKVESYYGTRYPSRSYLLRDRSNYIKRWPQRRYWLNARPKVTPLNDGTFEVVSRIGYQVSSRSKSSRGETTAITRVANTPNGLKIISVRER